MVIWKTQAESMCSTLFSHPASITVSEILSQVHLTLGYLWICCLFLNWSITLWVHFWLLQLTLVTITEPPSSGLYHPTGLERRVRSPETLFSFSCRFVFLFSLQRIAGDSTSPCHSHAMPGRERLGFCMIHSNNFRDLNQLCCLPDICSLLSSVRPYHQPPITILK